MVVRATFGRSVILVCIIAGTDMGLTSAHGNQKAIDALAAVANDPKETALWYMAAKTLEKSAGSGNAVAIDALIAITAQCSNENPRDKPNFFFGTRVGAT